MYNLYQYDPNDPQALLNIGRDKIYQNSIHYGPYRRPTFHSNIDDTAPPTRYVGTEIEIQGFDTNSTELIDQVKNTIDRWNAQTTYDGSLPLNGLEIRTAPAKGNLFIQQINEICQALNNAKAQVNRQCGLHIHIDARRYSIFNLRKLILTYHKLEPLLLRTQPFERIYPGTGMGMTNPCGQKLAEGLNELDTLLSTNRDHVKHIVNEKKKHTNRYHAFNIHSIDKHHTIEIRAHTGTTDPNDIINWALTWNAIFTAAPRLTPEQIKTLTPNLETLNKLDVPNYVTDHLAKRIQNFKSGWKDA